MSVILFPEIKAHLTGTELRRFRRVRATTEAVGANPAAFDAEQTINAYIEEYEIFGELIAAHNLIDSPRLVISEQTGECYYAEDRD